MIVDRAAAEPQDEILRDRGIDFVAKPGLSSRRGWRACLAAAGLIVLLDAAVKQTVMLLMPYGASVSLTPFFNLVHVWNTGAAFSFLADAGGWQRYLFTTPGIGVSVVLAWLLRRGVESRREAAAYTLIMGGALGNVADRIARGFVVDYLDFHWQGWHWPAFNLADMAIASGAALIVLASLRPGGSKAGQSGTPAKRARAR